jgi:predicted DNA-binding transcriptional regulator AlpA
VTADAALASEAPALMPLLVDVAGVAKLLGVGKATVWRLVAAGRLPPSLRLMRRRLWPVADIESFVASGCDLDRWKAQRRMEAQGRSLRPRGNTGGRDVTPAARQKSDDSDDRFHREHFPPQPNGRRTAVQHVAPDPASAGGGGAPPASRLRMEDQTTP